MGKPYNYSVFQCFRVSVAVFAVVATVTLSAQVPQPFPRPPQPQAPKTPPPTTAPAKPAAPNTAAQTQKPADPSAPTEAMLGAPIYPSAVYLTSYDAGRGQRFYLFGVAVPYADMVTYYKTILKQKGEELYEAPPTHQFETGKYKEETMAFVPSVTVKDYTYGGSAGFPNPKKGGPERFPTVIQIVPVPKD